ncbi:MAG TPA: RHS repeat-associated core domain-containing protein [Thermoanaerobaculia bacterium]|nr:RHS repeat-associated core domain-containing protein [Thermoanaerobaculia bacterium]
MRGRIFFALLIACVPLCADEVPQAVKALAHLKPKAAAGPVSWTAGPYQYDGAGNITAIGSEAFVYDKIGRLKTATVRGPDLSALQTQTFIHDEYGNLTATSKLGQTVLLPADSSTNRASYAGYDAAGNVVTSGTIHYDYDAAGMLSTIRLGSTEQPRIIYAYTADDERLFAFDVSTGITHWTVRGLDDKVLRDFRQQGTDWSVERDYIYRDGLLLAALKQNGAVEHYTLDHLGTPRLITDETGHRIGNHVYWPFGEEWSPGTAQEGSPLRFAGHERDADPSNGAAGLDYMHARYYGSTWGRFLSADPSGQSAKPGLPQSWNRYSYAANNPLKFVDPDGRELRVASDQARTLESLRLGLPPALRPAIGSGTNTKGQSIITVDNSTRTTDPIFKNLQRVINSQGVVEIVPTGRTEPIPYDLRDGSHRSTTFARIPYPAVTLPSRGTENDQLFSARPGVTEVRINSAQTAYDQAPQLAAEIGTHALPALTGKGASIPDQAEHTAREMPLQNEARSNRDLPP